MARVVSKKQDKELLWVFLMLSLAAIAIYLVSSDVLASIIDMVAENLGASTAKIADGLNGLSILAILAVLYGLFATYLWRPFRWFLGVPIIEGPWEGEITSDTADTPIEVSVTIEQQWKDLTMRFNGGDFTSHVILVAFDEDSAHRDRLKYLYFCEKQGTRDHFGTTLLTICDKDKMEGRYYTDKEEKPDAEHNYASRGRIVLRRVKATPAS